MEVAYKSAVHVCVCLECGTTLSVTPEALARFRQGRKKRRRCPAETQPRRESVRSLHKLFHQSVDLIELCLQLRESRELHVELFADFLKLILHESEDVFPAHGRSWRAGGTASAAAA
jgi:hypothetical protein